MLEWTNIGIWSLSSSIIIVIMHKLDGPINLDGGEHELQK